MSLFCIWRNWIRSVFRLLFRRGAEKRDNDLYVETLTEYLLHLRSLRPRSLSNPSLRSLSLSKGIPQKNLPMKGLWKGTVSSLTEAYTFLLNLPGVCLSRVECYTIADRLVYQVQINRQMVIIMREHAKGFDRWVDLTLLESKKPRLQIRLRLCEVVTRELVGH